MNRSTETQSGEAPYGRGISRRQLAFGGLLSATALGSVQTTLAASADTPTPSIVTPPGLQFVFESKSQVGTPIDMGTANGISRRYVPIVGGTVSGPRLNGTVISGTDMPRIHADGLMEIEARYLWRTQDGAAVQVTSTGIWRTSPEVAKRAAAGEVLDRNQFYIRTTPTFITTASSLRWLQESVFVGVVTGMPGAVALRIFAVL